MVEKKRYVYIKSNGLVIVTQNSIVTQNDTFFSYLPIPWKRGQRLRETETWVLFTEGINFTERERERERERDLCLSAMKAVQLEESVHKHEKVEEGYANMEDQQAFAWFSKPMVSFSFPLHFLFTLLLFLWSDLAY